MKAPIFFCIILLATACYGDNNYGDIQINPPKDESVVWQISEKQLGDYGYRLDFWCKDGTHYIYVTPEEIYFTEDKQKKVLELLGKKWKDVKKELYQFDYPWYIDLFQLRGLA